MINASTTALVQRLSPSAIDRLFEDAERMTREAFEGRSWSGMDWGLARDESVDVFRTALAQVEAFHPGTADHMGMLCDHIRELGLADALIQLNAHAHVAHAMRLCIEVFTRVYFSPAEVEKMLRDRSETGDLRVLAEDMYASGRILLAWLRDRLN